MTTIPAPPLDAPPGDPKPRPAWSRAGEALYPKLHRHSLVGSWFHAPERWAGGYMGAVVAEVAPTVYLAQAFHVGDRGAAAQHLVRLEAMDGWLFFDSYEAYREYLLVTYRGAEGAG